MRRLKEALLYPNLKLLGSGKALGHLVVDRISNSVNI
jgi:hypothetical protein